MRARLGCPCASLVGFSGGSSICLSCALFAISRCWSCACLCHVSGLHTREVLVLRDSDHVTDQGLRHVSALPALKRFALEGHSFTDAGLRLICASCPLQHLFLTKWNLSDAGLRHISELASLERLSFQSIVVTLDGVRHLARLHSLQSLRVGCVTDTELEQISSISSLRELHLFYAREFTDYGLRYLRRLPDLRILDLAQTAVTDDGLFHVGHLPQITDLNFSWCRKITDRGLRHLALGVRFFVKSEDHSIIISCRTLLLRFLDDIAFLSNLGDWLNKTYILGFFSAPQACHLRAPAALWGQAPKPPTKEQTKITVFFSRQKTGNRSSTQDFSSDYKITT